MEKEKLDFLLNRFAYHKDKMAKSRTKFWRHYHKFQIGQIIKSIGSYWENYWKEKQR